MNDIEFALESNDIKFEREDKKITIPKRTTAQYAPNYCSVLGKKSTAG